MAGKPARSAPFSESGISLNKYISDTGFCSRREADKYIDHGRVSINDNVALPGNRVMPGDKIEVDGESIGKKKAIIYIAYNKPTGITSTTDTKDKTNIVDAIGFPQRIFPIGRLDKDSEGLIFLTNDGDIVNKILRAGNEHEKEYIVTVDKPINYEFVTAMASGVRILKETTLPCKVIQEGKCTFRITLVQGLNRQIRRMCETLDYSVKMLKRVRIMNVHLGSLKTGHWRSLTTEELSRIMQLVNDSSSAPRIVKPQPKLEKKVEKSSATEQTVSTKKTAPEKVNKKPVKSPKTQSYKDFREAAKKGRRTKK